jgi:hypothetical protein
VACAKKKICKWIHTSFVFILEATRCHISNYFWMKIFRCIRYIIIYACVLFHILWNFKNTTCSMGCVCILYSVNCPTVISLPSMLLSLWRDTSSELWTPIHFFTFILPFTFTSIIYFLTNKYLLPHDTFNPLFYGKPVRLATSLQVGAKYFGCVVCRFHVAAGAKLRSR